MNRKFYKEIYSTKNMQTIWWLFQSCAIKILSNDHFLIDFHPLFKTQHWDFIWIRNKIYFLPLGIRPNFVPKLAWKNPCNLLCWWPILTGVAGTQNHRKENTGLLRTYLHGLAKLPASIRQADIFIHFFTGPMVAGLKH